MAVAEKVIYAEAKTGDRSTMQAWSSADEKEEVSGGFGDELMYSAEDDTFEYSLGSGISPTKTVPNPVPGDVVAGARLVADMADKDWE